MSPKRHMNSGPITVYSWYKSISKHMIYILKQCRTLVDIQCPINCYTAVQLIPGNSHRPAILEGNPSSEVSISIPRKSPPENSWKMKIFLLTFLPANHSHAHSGLWRALSLEGEGVQQASVLLISYWFQDSLLWSVISKISKISATVMYPLDSPILWCFPFETGLKPH